MDLSRRLILVVVLTVCTEEYVSARPDTVLVPADLAPAEGSLNSAVQAATASGTLSNTVFILEPGARYVLTGTITVPTGQRLTIIAPEPGQTQATAPPQILWTSGDGTTTYNVVCRGDIALRNVWMLYARTDGVQCGSSIMIEDSPDSINGQHGDFDGVIFDYAAVAAEGGGCVSVRARHFRGAFRNCYFRNCTDTHFRYYGRAVSFPFNSTGWHIDSIRFDNCTFANIGYVYMQEGGEYGDFVWFNHCTFMNTVMYTLESGWWHWLNVSNSTFVNTYMMGDVLWERRDSACANGGTIDIDSVASFGFPVPFSEADRHILFTHCSYAIEPWLRNYIESGYEGTLDSAWLDKKWWPHPQPMMNKKTRSFFAYKATWPYVSMGPLFDSTDPGFVLPPSNQIGIKTFLLMKMVGSEDTTWAFNPQDDVNGVWPMKEDLSYTNPALLTAGMDGFPLGDLYHWFPERFAAWKAQEATEQDRIMSWLSTGSGPDVVPEPSGRLMPERFGLAQNYPNPFNPTTSIGYSVGELGSRQQTTGNRVVKLAVYDLLGREVAVLVNETKPPGAYTAAFDGAGLAGGVYVYRLLAEGHSMSHKMLLLR